MQGQLPEKVRLDLSFEPFAHEFVSPMQRVKQDPSYKTYLSAFLYSNLKGPKHHKAFQH